MEPAPAGGAGRAALHGGAGGGELALWCQTLDPAPWARGQAPSASFASVLPALPPVMLQMEQLRRNSTSASASSGGGEVHVEDKQLHSFADLFNAIKVEDFSSYISKVRRRR